MRAKQLPLLAFVLALAVLALGCGRGEEIPKKDAAALVRDLDSVDRHFSRTDCQQAQTVVRRLRHRIGGLPGDVDRQVRSTLDDGVARLGELVKEHCKVTLPPFSIPMPKPRPVRPPSQYRNQ